MIFLNKCLVRRTYDAQCNSFAFIILWFLCLFKAECVLWDSKVYQDSTRSSLDSNCRREQFKCADGSYCIAETLQCDGKYDCIDGSDEEGCDLRSESVRLKRNATLPPENTGCQVPEGPANGVFVHVNRTLQPGEYLPNFMALITKCNARFKLLLHTKTYPVCLNGKWTSSPVQCARFCKSINSTKTYKVACKLHNGIPLDSCDDPVDGTIARIECNPFYENNIGNPTRICKDGTWDYPITDCRPVCGMQPPRGISNLGIDRKHVGLPWHTGIYTNDKDKTYLCGASILRENIIITAAVCLTDGEGNVLPKENYLIAAGKLYRQYDDIRDEEHVQYSTFKGIYIPERYKGVIGNFDSDLAIAVLSKPLKISIAVQPVCIAWNTDFEYQQLVENSLGTVSGWGFTNKGKSEDFEIKELDMPYVPFDRCLAQVPKNFRKYITYDKICTGIPLNGAAVCLGQGDGGGGLTFLRRHDNRHYIRGIVSSSTSTLDGGCDSSNYATHTLVSKHIDFIKGIFFVIHITRCNVLNNKLSVSCKFHEFKCKSGQCIDEDLLCDGRPDCQDQTDETSITCSTIPCPYYAYTCKYGACINLSHRCNGVQNCIDNSDEINCSKHHYISTSDTSKPVKHQVKVRKYLCQSGEIIDDELTCDGKPDCLDNSDETENLCKSLYCPYFTFRCSYGACIRLLDKCNGINNCADGSDENVCFTSSTIAPEMQTTKPPIILEKLFRCSSGEYIDNDLLCDGASDCIDQSDETAKECSKFHCPSFSYRCSYGACVLSGARCNGIKECADNSDEKLCSTSLQRFNVEVKKFKCNSGHKIDADMVCDGKADCTDVSDESTTICSEINCPRFAFRCKYGACVHGTARCNGVTECIDNSDEALCPPIVKSVTNEQV